MAGAKLCERFCEPATLENDMKRVKLPLWLQHFVAVMGGGGILLVAFLDSSVLSFPFITDALVMRLCMERPARTLYYAAMATLGRGGRSQEISPMSARLQALSAKLHDSVRTAAFVCGTLDAGSIVRSEHP